MLATEIERIKAECAECLADRTEFCTEEGITQVVECNHCRDKMNLIAEIERLQLAGANSLAGNAARSNASDYNGEEAPIKPSAQADVCPACGATNKRYQFCDDDWHARETVPAKPQ